MSTHATFLHEHSTVVDAHNDLLCLVVARPPDQWSDYFRAQWLPRLQRGGIDVQVLPVFVDQKLRPEGAVRQTLRMIEAAHVIAEGSPHDVALCLDGAQIDEAVDQGRLALVLALEGAPAIDEDIELVRVLFRLGVRIASLTHFGRNQLADGSGEDATAGGLTAAGVEAVAEMERCGMLVDVSHLSAPGLEHLLQVATRPVIATHSSARSLRDHHRNLSDRHLRLIGEQGGVVCVNFFAPFLHESDRTIGPLIDHLEHLRAIVGPSRVGLGSDFMQDYLEDLMPRWCEELVMVGVNLRDHIPGLAGPEGMPLVTEALVERGWPDRSIAGVLGADLMAYFRTELGVPAHARAHEQMVTR